MEVKNTEADAGGRFSSKSGFYARYRPGYPAAVLTFLEQHAGLSTQYVVADIGAGTGLLTRIFLDYGCAVFGVEPNDEMRAAAESILSAQERFHSVAGRAEATTLAEDSIDLIVVGQAFHWFDWPAARIEFQRILKPGGHVALVWNTQDQQSALVRGYQEVLRNFGGSYTDIDHSRPAVAEAIERFFAPAGYLIGEFRHAQTFDLEGLQGRFLSTSTAPLPGDEHYLPALTALTELYSDHANAGLVQFPYVSRTYVGQLQ